MSGVSLHHTWTKAMIGSNSKHLQKLRPYLCKAVYECIKASLPKSIVVETTTNPVNTARGLAARLIQGVASESNVFDNGSFSAMFRSSRY